MRRFAPHPIAAAALVLLLAAVHAHAQVKPVRPGDLDPHLDSLFTAGKFEQLEVEALRRLHTNRDSTPDERVAAHLYLGFTWELADRDQDAQSAFREALNLRPALVLDQVYVPPRLYEAFERARASFLADRNRAREQAGAPPGKRGRPLLGTALNAVLPGTGFMVSGQPLRGTIWTAAQLGAAGGLIYTLVETRKAHDDYLQAVNPHQIEARYETYNTWYHRSVAWAVAAAAVYVGAQIDYQAFGVSVQAGPGLTGDPAQPTLGLRLRLSR